MWRCLILAGLAAVSMAASGLAQTRNADAANAPAQTDEQLIERLQQEWMNAWVRQDFATLERILAPDYSLTVSSLPGRPITRQEWLAMVPRYTASRFEYRDMKVRVFGSTAVVSSIGRGIDAKIDGADRSFPFFLTDVWVKRQSRWQVVARYSSLPETQTESASRLRETR